MIWELELSALAVAADAADRAAAFVFDDAAAVGADALAEDAFFMLHFAAYITVEGQVWAGLN